MTVIVNQSWQGPLAFVRLRIERLKDRQTVAQRRAFWDLIGDATTGDGILGALWRLRFAPLVGNYEFFEVATLAAEEQSASVTIFIADDYAAWRRKVREILYDHPEWQIVGEASDGLDAVSKAYQLQPDIVIMDIGLPRLNGIAAARLIRQKSPRTAVVFLSMYQDHYFRQAALEAGAAYVMKAHAVTDLPRAITAALQGSQAEVKAEI